MLLIMINSQLQCSVEQTCWTYIKVILWCNFVNSNIYVHFHFSHIYWCKPHHPLRCLLLIHKLSLMNCLEITLPQYINEITQTSNLTPFKIVSHYFPQPSATKFVRLWKSYINQTDLRKACYSKLCPKSGGKQVVTLFITVSYKYINLIAWFYFVSRSLFKNKNY